MDSGQNIISSYLERRQLQSRNAGLVFAVIGVGVLLLILGASRSFEENRLLGYTIAISLFALPPFAFSAYQLRRAWRMWRGTDPLKRALTVEPQLIAAVYNVREEYRAEEKPAGAKKAGAGPSGDWLTEGLANDLLMPERNQNFDYDTTRTIQSSITEATSSSALPYGAQVVLTDGSKYLLESPSTTNALIEAIRAHAPHARTRPELKAPSTGNGGKG